MAKLPILVLSSVLLVVIASNDGHVLLANFGNLFSEILPQGQV